MLALAGSEWMVAWDEERGGNYDIWVRRARGGVAERITDSELWDTTPALARTNDGRVWLAWERKETIGGRFAYRGRSIFGKYLGWLEMAMGAVAVPGSRAWPADAALAVLGHRRHIRRALSKMHGAQQRRAVAVLARRRTRHQHLVRRPRLEGRPMERAAHNLQ